MLAEYDNGMQRSSVLARDREEMAARAQQSHGFILDSGRNCLADKVFRSDGVPMQDANLTSGGQMGRGEVRECVHGGKDVVREISTESLGRGQRHRLTNGKGSTRCPAQRR